MWRPRSSTRSDKSPSGYQRVLVCLDSNHTHEHVLEELRAYAPLVTPNSYCVVFDTIIEDMPVGMFPNRSWGPGNNPRPPSMSTLGHIPSSRSTERSSISF